MSDARVFPYAIVPASLPPPPDLTGLRGAPVELVTSGLLGAWASVVPPFSAVKADLVDHHRVVEHASAGGPALPVRFGTAFPTREALAASLLLRAAPLAASLDRVGPCREVAITLEWRSGSRSDAAPDVASTSTDGPALGPGRQYLADRAKRWSASDSLRRRAEHLSDEVQGICLLAGASAADVKRRIVPAPRIALSCSVLTDPSRADELLRRVREEADGWEDVWLHLAGPWPPYSFSDTE